MIKCQRAVRGRGDLRFDFYPVLSARIESHEAVTS